MVLVTLLSTTAPVPHPTVRDCRCRLSAPQQPRQRRLCSTAIEFDGTRIDDDNAVFHASMRPLVSLSRLLW